MFEIIPKNIEGMFTNIVQYVSVIDNGMYAMFDRGKIFDYPKEYAEAERNKISFIKTVVTKGSESKF